MRAGLLFLPLLLSAAPASPPLVQVEVKDVVPLKELNQHAVVLVSKEDGTVLPLFVDETAGFVDPAQEDFMMLDLGVLDLPRRQEFLFRYDVMELSTAVKPYLLRWLFVGPGGGRTVYNLAPAQPAAGGA